MKEKKREFALALAFVSVVAAACVKVMRAASDALGHEKKEP